MKKEVAIFTFQVLDRETFEVVGYDRLFDTGWSIAGQGGIRRFSSNEKDRNGITIYNGDILLCNDIHYQVVFHLGGFWVEVGEESTNLTSYTDFNVPYDFEKVSVVGNKYTRPVLWEDILSDDTNSTKVY